VTHWTQVLTNVSLVEFVLLAALTSLQWLRHRIRGAGWVALSFAILAVLSLTVKIDPAVVTHQFVAKSMVALLLVMPYCLFRFAASFRTPSRIVRVLAVGVTAGIIAFTFWLEFLPVSGSPPPPYFLAYRVAFAIAFGFLFSYVVVRLFLAGRGEPPIAATRMHLLAIAVAGLEVQVVVVALGLQGATVRLVTQATTVAMGILFLIALVLPSFVRVLLSRREDVARFCDWDNCASIEVEHASHGERVLTLMEMAAEYDRQAGVIASRRAAGRPSNYEETMYILDLGLDTQCADLPTKPVPWDRFESTLKQHGIKALSH